MAEDSRKAAANLYVGVNEPADMKNLSDLEKKHLPSIDCPEEIRSGECIEVKVEIGRLLAHPNEHKHFVQFVELYADKTFLCRADFTSVRSCPKVSFFVSVEKPARELVAYEHCNLHGTWACRKPLKFAD